MVQNFDVVVIGGGAAGMMCAIEAGRRGRSVLVVEHNKSVGDKIRISGGGRCNFTNVNCSAKNFLSENPHFCISALKRYRPQDFIDKVEQHGISYHVKTLGQLFCDGSAVEIIDMLKAEMAEAGVKLRLGCEVNRIEKVDNGFELGLVDQRGAGSGDMVSCSSLVVATGGKSIPKMGASGFGLKVAEQFGLSQIESRAALVPLTFDEQLLAAIKPLSGIGIESVVGFEKTSFAEAMLFTHRGLSGPAILQISSFWKEGKEIKIDMLPGVDVFELLRTERGVNGRREVQTVLYDVLPKRVVEMLVERAGVAGRIADLSDKKLRVLGDMINRFTVRPVGTEGYRTAEVMLGGVDTRALNSKTMMANDVEGLYFIGEVVDVTGWLGGYNFQWAWSSGWSAGQVV